MLKPQKTETTKSGLVLHEFLLPLDNPKKISLPAKRTSKQPLIGVTLHNTSWISTAAGTTPAEQYTRATYNGNMGDARVHWFVDNVCAWRNFSDEYASWHCATGGQGQGNVNTISIECIMRNQTDAESVASMENTAKLIAWIFDKYGWTVEKNLFTHNYWTNYKATGKMSDDLDAQSLKKVSTSTKCYNSTALANASGKYCPLYLIPQWEKFKALVKKYMGATAASPAAPAEPATPASQLYRVRKSWADSESQLGAFGSLDNAKKLADENKAKGYIVFDSDGAVAYDPNAVAAPPPSQPAPSAENDAIIWGFLSGKGLNGYAVAGLMGNLFAESGLIPTNLQNTYEKSLGMTDAQYTAGVDDGSYTNFIRDSAGYGLAQWTFWSRKEALLNFVKAAGTSIGDMFTQLEFLWKELQGYTAMMNVLLKATSVRQASDVVLLQFERPADQSEAVQVKRASYGQTYYDKYTVEQSGQTGLSRENYRAVIQAKCGFSDPEGVWAVVETHKYADSLYRRWAESYGKE